MSDAPLDPAAATAPEQLPDTGRSALSDGEWHRMHPLTPLFRGGLFVVVVVGLIIANFRDRLLGIFLPTGVDVEMVDPVDFVLQNNLILGAIAAVLVVAAALMALFYLSWRFHLFRITGDDVEVRQGVLFRSHRRAPLDRVQGVNLTRPMIARLVGLAKLEVIGAGLDANVKLEYLSTTNAESVRTDILRLASGVQLQERSGGAGPARSAAGTVSAGIAGIVGGTDEPAAEPESVVRIPVGRLIGSQLLSPTAVGLVGFVVTVVILATTVTPWAIFGFAPGILAFGAVQIRGVVRSLRYSIAAVPSGVRVTFGLFTTVTEILPPGRVHAVEVRQSILWRRFGWWSVVVNRLSGGGDSAAHITMMLPVGTRADVERVLRLVLPNFPDDQWPDVFERGILGPADGDPYTNTPRRARLLRPLSWRRNGFLLTAEALYLRRGYLWRSLAIFPLARVQSVGITQAPLGRAMTVASLRAHTITGPVYGTIGALDRDDVVAALEATEAAVVTAAAGDRSHRWAGA